MTMSDTDNPVLENEQRYRASAYALLAALLRAAPDQALLDYVGGLSAEAADEADALAVAMSALASAARDQDVAQLEFEYNDLFIGVGRGEIVPFGSWYLTGFLMEQPLSDLRDHLRDLGFERNEDTHEPEDHVAAIFEVFSVMIGDAFSLSRQQEFFKMHMQPWLERFFADLGQAKSAEFYRPVAQFGVAFLDLESAYLSLRS
jgi:TorA maturation chaperone TorD